MSQLFGLQRQPALKCRHSANLQPSLQTSIGLLTCMETQPALTALSNLTSAEQDILRSGASAADQRRSRCCRRPWCCRIAALLQAYCSGLCMDGWISSNCTPQYCTISMQHAQVPPFTPSREVNMAGNAMLVGQQPACLYGESLLHEGHLANEHLL